MALTEVTILRDEPAGAAMRNTLRPAALDELAGDFRKMLAEGLHPGAQLAVFRNGEFITSLAGGDDGADNPVTSETLFQIRSVTKAVMALTMLTLHNRGRFDYDDPVAKHWPGFGRNGKEAITIGQLMSHRAGIPDGPRVPHEEWGDRDAVAKDIEDMTPIWPPGTANGYHAHTFGLTLNELAWRWEGKPLGQFLADEITGPLGIPDVYLGLPESAFPRMAKMVILSDVPAGRRRNSEVLDTAPGVAIPRSAVASAVSLANLMSVAALEGAAGGRTFFTPAELARASVPTNGPGVIDLRLRRHVRWGFGFILGDSPDIYGTPPHPRAVGHAGGGASVAWGDPDERLAVAFLCNGMLAGGKEWERYRRISDLVYAALH